METVYLHLIEQIIETIQINPTQKKIMVWV